MDLKEIRWQGVDWMHLALNIVRWWNLLPIYYYYYYYYYSMALQPMSGLGLLL
jgi:hypothetical protein